MTVPPPNQTREEPQEVGDTCSFCGKRDDEVGHLVKGPNVNICNECVHLCHEIVCEVEMRKAEAERAESEDYSQEENDDRTETAYPNLPDFETLTLEGASAEFERFVPLLSEALAKMIHHEQSAKVFEKRVTNFSWITKKLEKIIDGRTQ